MVSLTAFEDGDAAFAYTPWVSDAEAKDDFTPEKAAFALRNNGTKFYDYVAQPQGQETLHKLLNGVAPWLNQITRPALLHDFPWASLDKTTIIDLGCESGDVGVDILKLYPNITRWDFQDPAPVIERTKAAFTPQLETLGLSSRATFTAQDYFEHPNVSSKDTKGPIVFFMRGVPRHYGDPQALDLFRATAASMRACHSSGEVKLPINQIVCPSAAVVDEDALTRRAPPSGCIPAATQSSLVETANVMAMSATTFLNGAERPLHTSC